MKYTPMEELKVGDVVELVPGFWDKTTLHAVCQDQGKNVINCVYHDRAYFRNDLWDSKRAPYNWVCDEDTYPVLKVGGSSTLEVIHSIPVDTQGAINPAVIQVYLAPKIEEGEIWVRRNIRAWPYNKELKWKLNPQETELQFYWEEKD